MINKSLFAVVVAGFVTLSASAARAGPTMQPWCTDGRGWGTSTMTCQFETYQQCKANGGFCVANPAIDPLPQAPSDFDSSGAGSTRTVQANSHKHVAPRTAAGKAGTIYLLENRGGVPGASSRTPDRSWYDKQSGHLW
jgi:hypothetical protein